MVGHPILKVHRRHIVGILLANEVWQTCVGLESDRHRDHAPNAHLYDRPSTHSTTY